MLTSKIRHYLSLIFLLTCWFASAQPGRSPSGEQRGGIEANLTGNIIDESSKPLEFATVSLLNKEDSALVDGAISDSEGGFMFRVRPGNYLVKIQFVTYESKTIPVSIERGQPVNLDKIMLIEATTALDEVVVQGERTQMELQLDKKVYNVGKDLSNLGGSASDILDNLPSVAVDVEGNVSLRGSDDVRILIDGKPSGLVGLSSSAALKQLQGNMIERVEIITNPSARYGAAGLAGIINIVLKKEKSKGLNGSFQVNTGAPHNHGVSINMNMRKNWLNFFTNFGITYRNSPGRGSADIQYTFPDTSYFTTTNRNMQRGGINYSTRLGADFYLGEKSTLTAYMLYRFSDEDNLIKINYLDYDINSALTRTLRKQDEFEGDENVELSLNYVKDFSRKGHKFNIDLQYQDNNEKQTSNLIQSVGPSKDELLAELYQKSTNDEGEKRYMFQTDYTHPFSSDANFELGSRITAREIHNDYLVERGDGLGNYLTDPNLTNDFLYIENIYAGYGIISNKFQKLSYQFGGRIEVTDIETKLVNNNFVNTQHYANFFPSTFFTYDFTDIYKLQLSYSRRVRRPRFRDLNPFISISDSRLLWAGNPNLKPEFTDSYELGMLQNYQKASVYYGVYYRYTENVSQRVATLTDTLGLVNVRMRRPENLGFRNSIGAEMNASKDLAKWYRVTGNANLYWSHTEGIVSEGTSQQQNLSAEALSFMTRISNNFKIPNVMDAQVNLMYRAPQNSTQGRSLAMGSVDLGFSREILDKNGTISLSVRDLFNTRKHRGITDLENYYEKSEFQWRSRQATVSFIYRLNQKNQRRRGGNREEGDFDEGDVGF